jgi:hypothetical protein
MISIQIIIIPAAGRWPGPTIVYYSAALAWLAMVLAQQKIQDTVLDVADWAGYELEYQ